MRSVVTKIFKASSDVERDMLIKNNEELHLLKEELEDEALADIPDVPTLDSTSSLVNFLSSIIWTCSGTQFKAYL